MAVLVAMIAQFLIGYNTGVMNAPEAVVFPGHTTVEWSIAVAAFAIGGPFGAVLGGHLANRRGRRGAMMFNTGIFFIGGVVMTFAPNVYWLWPARLMVGIASGLASVVTPVYLGEIAPPTLRGTLGTCTQFAMVIGILMSGVFAFPLANASGWRLLFGVTPILCVLQVCLLYELCRLLQPTSLPSFLHIPFSLASHSLSPHYPISSYPREPWNRSLCPPSCWSPRDGC